MSRITSTVGRILAALVASCALVAPVLHAQEEAPAPGSDSLVAIIAGPQDIRTRRTIILDGSASHVIGNNVQYFWYVNNNPEPISKTVDTIFTPEKAGEYTFRLLIRTTINDQPREVQATHVVSVYERKIVLITDGSVPQESVDALRRKAAASGAYLLVLSSDVPATSRGGEEALSRMIRSEDTSVLGAESVVLWIDGIPIPGLQALAQLTSDPARSEAMQNQTFVLISDRRLWSVARAVQGPLSLTHPKRAIVTRPSAIDDLLTSRNDDAFMATLKQRQDPATGPLFIDPASVHVDDIWLLSRLERSMLTAGISNRTILLLLVLPVIATILSFLKQVVGITTFGLFAPAIISLSFVVLGWWVGVLFLLFILATGYASRALMRRWHLLYIPKMAIILGVGSITLLLLLGIGTLFGIILSPDTVFVLLIMSTLVESFLNVKSEQGLLSAILAIGQTILASLLCVLIVRWSPFETLIIAYPETILLTILINVLLGRFTGLRLTEYFRFREVFKHLVEE